MYSVNETNCLCCVSDFANDKQWKAPDSGLRSVRINTE